MRDARCDEPTWSAFDAALRAGAPGNEGVLGLHLPTREITPMIARTGTWHVDASDAPLAETELDSAQAVRAIVEGRFLSMRARGGAIGLRGATRVLATGGGSQSAELLQVCADVFDAPVLADDTPDAAAVGAAKRAAHALTLAAEHGGSPTALPYDAFLKEREQQGGGDGAKLEVMAEPRADAARAYDEACVARYKALEDRVAAGA